MMAFTETEKNEYEHLVSNLIENRRRQAIENGFDLGYLFNNQSIELFEIHPSSHHKQGFFHSSVAKITFIRTTKIWKISWMRGSLEWKGYRINSKINKLSEALFIVNEDPDGCFWKLSSAK
ncbi:MAG: hypothetical protein ACJAZP_000133 [Psychromonas sp.]|jgi:hypothetical protein